MTIPIAQTETRGTRRFRSIVERILRQVEEEDVALQTESLRSKANGGAGRVSSRFEIQLLTVELNVLRLRRNLQRLVSVQKDALVMDFPRRHLSEVDARRNGRIEFQPMQPRKIDRRGKILHAEVFAVQNDLIVVEEDRIVFAVEIDLKGDDERERADEREEIHLFRRDEIDRRGMMNTRSVNPIEERRLIERKSFGM